MLHWSRMLHEGGAFFFCRHCYWRFDYYFATPLLRLRHIIDIDTARAYAAAFIDDIRDMPLFRHYAYCYVEALLRPRWLKILLMKAALRYFCHIIITPS